MKKLVMLFSFLIMFVFIGCALKDPETQYDLAPSPGFRMSDTDHITALASGDRFMIEDVSSSGDTEYTTMDDINTYIDEIRASDYANLATAISEIGSANATLIIDSAESLSDNATFPATLSVEVVKPGCITIASGKKLTINGPLDSYLGYVFRGDGSVEFGSDCPVIEDYPQWWGAKGDGVTDDSAAIQSAIDAFEITSRGNVFFPLGTYIIKNVNCRSKVSLSGAGFGSIIELPAAVPDDTVMFNISGKSDIIIQSLAFDSNGTGGAGAQATRAIYIQSDSHDILVTDCSFYNNVIDASSVTVSSPSGHLCYNVVVDSCIFNNLDVGIMVFGGRGITVSNNVFKDIVSEAISFWSDNSTFELNYECQAIGNSIENVTSGRAIVFRNCNGFSCCSNTMKTLVNGGIALDDSINGVVNGNTIRSYASVANQGGIEILAGATLDNIVISGNMIVNAVNATGSRAINFWDSGAKTNISITDNIIDDTVYGIYLKDVTHAVITGNLITNISGRGIRAVTNTDYLFIVNNKIWDTVSEPIYVDGAHVRVNNNFTDDASPSVFTDTDATPVVNGNYMRGNVFKTFTNTLTITDFDNGYVGQEITVISKAAITFDTTTAQDADHNLDGSTVNIVTATGDITQWVCEDGTTWRLVGFVDASVDNSGGA